MSHIIGKLECAQPRTGTLAHLISTLYGWSSCLNGGQRGDLSWWLCKATRWSQQERALGQTVGTAGRGGSASIRVWMLLGVSAHLCWVGPWYQKAWGSRSGLPVPIQLVSDGASLWYQAGEIRNWVDIMRFYVFFAPDGVRWLHLWVHNNNKASSQLHLFL